MTTRQRDIDKPPTCAGEWLMPPGEPTDEDRQRADQIVSHWPFKGNSYFDRAVADIAQALADERARARETFLPNNPDVGKVAFRVEAWPHDPGANGEAYHAGHAPADDAARALRDIADQIDGWADPECPWAGQDGHAPATPQQDRREAEEAKAAAYARRAAEEAEQ